MNTGILPTAGDTTPPSPPTGLTATAAGPGQVNLNWTASTDNVGVSGYRVERCQGAGCTNFAQVGTPTATAYSDTGLRRAPPTATRCGRSTRPATSAPTPRSPRRRRPRRGDTTPPSPPTGLTATAAGADPDRPELDRLDRQRRGQRLPGRALPGRGLHQLRPGRHADRDHASATPACAASTTYRFRVRAVDAAGNLSAYSSIATATTPAAADTTAPTRADRRSPPRRQHRPGST